jgi:hypothetical protein
MPPSKQLVLGWSECRCRAARHHHASVARGVGERGRPQIIVALESRVAEVIEHAPLHLGPNTPLSPQAVPDIDRAIAHS